MMLIVCVMMMIRRDDAVVQGVELRWKCLDIDGVIVVIVIPSADGAILARRHSGVPIPMIVE